MKAIKRAISKAPKEWESIDIVKQAKRKGLGFESSLQRLEGTNICFWMINHGDGKWILDSGYFIIKFG